MFRLIVCQVWLHPPRSHSKRLYFLKNIALKIFHFLRHWKPDGPQKPQLFVIRTHPDFWFPFPPKQLILFLLSSSQPKTVDFFCDIPPKSLEFDLCSGLWLNRNAEKCWFFRHAWIFKLIFLFCSTCFNFLLGNESLVVFLLAAEYLFLNIMKFDLYIAIKNLIGRKWQKCS